MSQALCIFARTPELGLVKQRLAAALGDRQALAAHEQLLRRTIQRTAASERYETQLWLTRLTSDLPGWLRPHGVSLNEQPAGDLGQRMQLVMERTLAGAERCVLIGSDCPDIDSDYVSAAFDALHSADVVFGPAEDGGYALVGLNRSVPEAFAESAWGDPAVLARALARLARANVAVSLLPEVYDVDEVTDWQRFLADQDS